MGSKEVSGNEEEARRLSRWFIPPAGRERRGGGGGLLSAALFAEVSFSCQLAASSSHAQNRRAVAALLASLHLSALDRLSTAAAFSLSTPVSPGLSTHLHCFISSH